MNRLKQLRKQKKLTQEELAELIGVTKRTVSHWENTVLVAQINSKS